MRHTLSRRQAIWSLVAVFVALTAIIAGIGYWVWSTQRASLQRSAEQSLKLIGDLEVDRTTNWLARRCANAEVMQSKRLVVEALQSAESGRVDREIEHQLEEFLASFQRSWDYTDVAVVDSAGVILWRAPTSAPQPLGKSTRQLIAEAAASRQVEQSDIYLDAGGQPRIDFVAPIVDSVGDTVRSIGAVVLRDDPQRVLYPRLQQWPLPSASGKTLLVERDGDEVVYLNELRHRGGTTSMLRRPLASPELVAAMAARGGGGATKAGVDYRGVSVLSYSRPVSGSDWSIVTEIDSDEVLGAAVARALLGVVVAVVAAVAVGLGVLLVLRSRERRASATLRQSEHEMHALADFTYDWEYWLAPDGSLNHVSPSCERISGYSPEEFLADPELLLRIVHPDERQGFERHQKEQLAGAAEACEGLEFRILRKDGDERWIGHACQAVSDSDGTYQGVRASNRDVTKQRRADTALRESQARFSALFDSMLEGYAYCRMLYDEEGRPNDYVFVAVNPAFNRLTGLSDVVGRKVSEVIPTIKDETPEVFEIYGGVVASGEAVEFEIDFTPLKMWLRISATRPQSGHFLAVFEDITERKQAEGALLHEKETTQRYLDVAPTIILALDAGGRVTLLNDEGARILGCAREAAIGSDWFETFLPERLRVEVRAVFAEIMAGTMEGADVAAHVVLTGHGEERLIRWRNALLRDDEGAPIGTLSSGEDITERKQAEEAVRESEASLSKSQAIAHVGSWELDLLTDRRIWSDETYRIFGLRPQEFVATYAAYLEAVHPDDRAAVDDAFTKAISEGPDSYEIEHRIVRSDSGEVRVVREKCEYIRDASGRAVRSVGVVQDITERHEARQALAASAARLHTALGETVAAMGGLVSLRDPYTGGHEQRVTRLSAAIATEMGLDEKKREGLTMAAEVHDIGKISIPAEILSKPTELNEMEFRLIKQHPTVGAQIVSEIDFEWPVAEIVAQHHERLDGSGYPDGLKGDETLLEARILAVADVVEAMASHRPYRAALGIEAALTEIRQGAGTLYDAEAVAACESVIAGGFSLEESSEE